jgi:hypothetical protein
MVFNATFNNISVILWRSVLLVEETGGPGENHGPVASHWQTFSHNVISGTPCHERVRTPNLLVIGTDCTGDWPPQYNWNIVESGIKHHKPLKNNLDLRLISCMNQQNYLPYLLTSNEMYEPIKLSPLFT